MATRPSITVNVRASQANYTTGPAVLIGTATKITRAGADITEGYKVDSPLGTSPVSAQETNFEDNRNDQWVLWVSEGSSAAGGDTHIVETDSSGDINVVGVNSENIRVTPNTGNDGIEVTTSGGSKGVEVLQDATSTDHGVNVTSTVGAAAPAYFASTRSNVGVLVSHGSLAGLSIGATANGGVVGPSIALTSNTIESNDDTVGTFWNREQNSIKNVKMGMGTSAGYPIIAKNAPCYARSGEGTFVLTGSQTNQTIRSNFSFKTDQLPQDSDSVRVVIWGQTSLFAGQENEVTLKVRDVTAGNITICEITLQSVNNSGSSFFIQHSATFSETYILPSSGARTFDLVWTGDVTGNSGSFSGYVEIEQLRG